MFVLESELNLFQKHMSSLQKILNKFWYIMLDYTAKQDNDEIFKIIFIV